MSLLEGVLSQTVITGIALAVLLIMIRKWTEGFASELGKVDARAIRLEAILEEVRATAYGGEKGKNLARQEDLDQIISELRAVTITQKEIEANISGALWDQQTRRTEKKEIYAQILSAVHNVLTVSNKLKAVSVMLEACGEEESDERNHVAAVIDKDLRRYASAERRLIRLQGLSFIFASSNCAVRLAQFLGQRRTEVLNPLVWSKTHDNATKLQGDIIRLAKADLGIE